MEGDVLAVVLQRHKVGISIHALRVEGDSRFRRNVDTDKAFLSTPSGWRATRVCGYRFTPERISIHALRVEGDILNLLSWYLTAHFYPRPPGGGRPSVANAVTFDSFISIHALRVEGDIQRNRSGRRHGISIHALRVEGDSRSSVRLRRGSHFYPRPPGGGRPHSRHNIKSS